MCLYMMWLHGPKPLNARRRGCALGLHQDHYTALSVLAIRTERLTSEFASHITKRYMETLCYGWSMVKSRGDPGFPSAVFDSKRS